LLVNDRKEIRNVSAVSICCEESEVVDFSPIIYFKKHVSKGDYQQRKGKHSERVIPTGKLFGLRKFDYIQTPKGIGFIKGKRSDGRFAICDIFWNTINGQVQIKKNHIRLNARTTTLIERRKAHSPMGQAAMVPCV
jgi:hypothetical protein